MKLLLTEAQLLDEWRLRSFPEPANTGCSVEYVGGVDIDRYMKARMNEWYGRLLAEAPLNLLYPVEIKVQVRPSLTADGLICIPLPDEVVRVASLRLDGFAPSAVVVDSAGVSAFRPKGHRYRSARQSPVAVVVGRELWVYPIEQFGAVPTVESLTAVVDVPGEYRLDNRALQTITPDAMYAI